ncbi:MAG TPA: Imm52 family immunity protein [Pirellulales bacterium]|nr:Imm52 family immunity protein [Pirellulales bacterium]
MNRFNLLAYWSARPETAEQCADRLLRFFAALMRCDPTLARWFKKGRSRKDALRHQLDVANRESLLAMLENGRNRTDVGNQIIYELGFSVYLWNGEADDHAVGLSIGCGSCAQYSLLPNNVILDLADELDGLIDAANMQNVLEATVTAWEPIWAGIMSDEAQSSRGFPADPFIDWMVYLANEWLPTAPALSPPASAKALDNGTIIVVQDEPPDPNNGTHLENIRRVESALRSVWRVPSEVQAEANRLRRLHYPGREVSGG